MKILFYLSGFNNDNRYKAKIKMIGSKTKIHRIILLTLLKITILIMERIKGAVPIKAPTPTDISLLCSPKGHHSGKLDDISSPTRYVW
jgi:hypothetical protein